MIRFCAVAVLPNVEASAAVKVTVLVPTPTVVGMTIVVSNAPLPSVVPTFVATVTEPDFNVTVTELFGTQPAPVTGTDCPMVAVAIATDIVGTVIVNLVVPVNGVDAVSDSEIVFSPIPAPDGMARLMPGTSPEDVKLATAWVVD
jgi:hypothetical protein